MKDLKRLLCATIVCFLSVGLLFFSSLLAEEKKVSHKHEMMKHEKMDHVVIRIGAIDLMPKVEKIKTGTAVVFMNYGKTKAKIEFLKEVSTSFKCEEALHFNLGKDGVFRSGELKRFEIASVCFELPGEYTYIVNRTSEATGGTGQAGKLQGTIIVSE